jgi:dethiobiotin synthetase
MKPYFITGTDTNCGKTYVTKKLMQETPNSVAIKPLASGCIQTEHGLVSEDALELKHADLSLEQINPWRFAKAVSPHIAAKEEGKQVSAKELVDFCLQFEKPNCETLFIEGAGGLLVPLNDKETWIDFLKLSKIPVILVVGMKLGCINHTFLTQTALAAHGIECIGWIANCIDPNMQAFDENIATLKDNLPFPLLRIFMHDPGNSGI